MFFSLVALHRVRVDVHVGGDGIAVEAILYGRAAYKTVPIVGFHHRAVALQLVAFNVFPRLAVGKAREVGLRHELHRRHYEFSVLVARREGSNQKE